MQGDQHKQHISGQFNAELDAMKNHLLEMGGLVEQQLGLALHALLTRDSGEAGQVIVTDKEINAMELQIDQECSRILARRQPAASDLRLVLAVVKSTTDLERIGDEATRIARQAIRLSELPPSASSSVTLREIGAYVSEKLRDALDSFARLDVAQALDVVMDESDVDEQHDAGIDELIRQMHSDSENIRGSLQEMWAFRGLERVGAHATNIAEQVVYLGLGKDVRHMNQSELEAILDARNAH